MGLRNADDEVDTMTSYILNVVTNRHWEHSTREAVDLARGRRRRTGPGPHVRRAQDRPLVQLVKALRDGGPEAVGRLAAELAGRS